MFPQRHGEPADGLGAEPRQVEADQAGGGLVVELEGDVDDEGFGLPLHVRQHGVGDLGQAPVGGG